MSKNRLTFDNELVLRDAKVGIGTSVPTSSLNVVGDVDFKGPVKITSVGSTTAEEIQIKHYRDNGGSTVYEIEDRHLFSIDNSQDGITYSINDTEARPTLTVSDVGITTIRDLYPTTTTYTSVASTSFENIQVKHNRSNNGAVVYNSTDRHLFSIDNSQDGITYSINDTEARPALTVSDAGITTIIDLYTPRTTYTSVGSTAFENIQVKHNRSNNGAVVYNSTDKQYFSIDNSQDGITYSINDSEARSALTVSDAGITTIRDLYPTTTTYTSVASTSFENIQVKHYRNIAYQPTVLGFDTVVVATGAIIGVSTNIITGISTSNITVGLEIQAITNVISAGTTVVSIGSSQVGIGTTTLNSTQQNNVNVYFGRTIGVAINNRGAISFDSPSGISTDGISLFSASLFALTNDPTGNIFSVVGYGGYWSGSSGGPAIDVTQFGRIGIGTTTPITDFHINRQSYFTQNIGINTTTPAAPLDVRGDLLIAGSNASLLESITIKPQTAGINTLGPSRGSIFYEGKVDTSLNGGQLVTILNDNSNLFTINGFAGLSSLSYAPAGQRNVQTILNVTSSGNIGIGTTRPLQILQIGNTNASGISTDTNVLVVTSTGSVGLGTTDPRQKLDVIGNANITGVTTVGLGSTSSPTVNSTMSFELTNNTTLTVRVRGTDGVVRTGIVSLT